MISELQNRYTTRRLDLVIVLLLTMLAFWVRFDRIAGNSLTEDESAKVLAVQEYRQGHFAGVNSEHPMLMKALAWASVEAGERWNQNAVRKGWPVMALEGWLRLPNVLFGTGIAAVLYLLCRQLMGLFGSFTAGYFFAISPMPVAFNRITKEETAVTFFTLLACYFYLLAKRASSERRKTIWVDLSAFSFGFAMASQYLLHLFGLNALAWLIAAHRGVDRRTRRVNTMRLMVVFVLAFLLANPLLLSPASFSAIVTWLHHGSVHHSGYDFGGKLYLNFPSLLFWGVPWYYYLWFFFVKTPIPVLAAMIAGSLLLLRDRKTFASCLFLAYGVIQLAGLSISGAKWMRYTMPMLPFFMLAAGYAMDKAWELMRARSVPRVLMAFSAIVICGWPLLELHAWAPNYAFYQNAFGGGTRNICRYFSPDEVSEFDSREVAHQVCLTAPLHARLVTARPMSMAHYVHQQFNRPDIAVVPIYDPQYVPRNGDVIVVEPSRRFFETSEMIDLLKQSGMPRQEVRYGPVTASVIYHFQLPAPATGGEFLLANSRDARPMLKPRDVDQNTAGSPMAAGRHGFQIGRP
jgi:hypothetical protein